MTQMPLPGQESDGTETVVENMTPSRRPLSSNLEDHFGDEVAARYDDDGEMFEPELIVSTVDFLASFCDGGRALEFGIGTGRVAIPLSQRGIELSGIDLSSAMLSVLESKEGADQIETVIGDFATTRLPGRFDLVYLIFNTIMNLTSQRQQVDCFENASSHLEPGGHFVIEVMVPALRRLPPGQNIHPFDVSDSHWGFDEYDVVEQGLISHHLNRTEEGLVRASVPFRYVWPSELDLMAEIAGMSLVGRWADWNREPFTEASESHVSVWRRHR